MFKHFIFNNLIHTIMSVSTIKIETDLITLMDVLNQTGNPTVAIEMLNGTYQAPEICTGDKLRLGHKDEPIKLTYASYDRFKDEVCYSRNNWGHDTMSRETWNKLELWADHVRRAMAEAILNDVDDIADTEHGF